MPDAEFATRWLNIESGALTLGSQDENEQSPTGSDSAQSNGSRNGGGPDCVVIFEGPHTQWCDSAVQERTKALLRHDRSSCCYMIHSVPSDQMTRVVQEAKLVGSYLFLTNLCENFYESFVGSLKPFVQAISIVEE